MINPQLIMQVQQMAQKGTQIKDILLHLRNGGFTPDYIEEILCESFPKLKQAKQAIANSGMSTQQYLLQLAKQNNISSEQINNMMSNFNNLLR